MLVQINGNIIDTNNIWRVSSINKAPDEITFSISMFNKIEHYIIKRTSFTYGLTTGNPVQQEDNYMKGLEYLSLLSKVETVRSKLIEYWNKSKSAVPEIKI